MYLFLNKKETNGHQISSISLSQVTTFSFFSFHYFSEENQKNNLIISLRKPKKQKNEWESMAASSPNFRETIKLRPIKSLQFHRHQKYSSFIIHNPKKAHLLRLFTTNRKQQFQSSETPSQGTNLFSKTIQLSISFPGLFCTFQTPSLAYDDHHQSVRWNSPMNRFYFF